MANNTNLSTTERLEQLKRAEQTFKQTHFYNAPCMSIYNIFDVATFGQFTVDNDPQMYSLCSGYKSIYALNISDIMNGPIRKKLGIIPDDLIWKRTSSKVYWAQVKSNDLYQDKWPIIDKLLKSSNIDVIVYQGQLDLICNTPATIAWVQKLTWPGLVKYNAAETKTLANPVTHVPEMFVKSYGHFKFYWILNSGHAVPADVPDVALRMLNRIMDDKD